MGGLLVRDPDLGGGADLRLVQGEGEPKTGPKGFRGKRGRQAGGGALPWQHASSRPEGVGPAGGHAPSAPRGGARRDPAGQGKGTQTPVSRS